MPSGLFPFDKLRPNVPLIHNATVGGKDPWARRDAWRNDPFWAAGRRNRAIFPGFGIATVAFTIYLAYDHWYWTQGPGKEETEAWAKWTEERNARLAKEHHHH